MPADSNYMDVLKNEIVIELAAYCTWMGDDGIARTMVKPDADITITDARENSIAVNSLYTGTNFPLLVDPRNIRSISKEAREHFSMNNRDSHVIAFAIIIDSPISKIIGNFFMLLNKPRVPARLFNSEENALKWLKGFL
jgi:hypothetical protein